MVATVENLPRFNAQGDGPERPRALLVDDDRLECGELAELLGASGLDVAVAYTPMDALARLRRESFSILVVDVRMPQMDGLTLGKMVRSELGASAPSLIYLSGAATKETVADAFESEAVDFVFKPCDPERLMNAIGRALLHEAEGRSSKTAEAEPPARTTALPDQVTDALSGDDGRFVATVSRLSTERQLRSRHFSEGVADGPAWSILLELAQGAAAGQRCYVSGVAVGAGVPLTTALRHLDYLEREGWVLREADPEDRRRVTLQLSSQALAAMRAYVEDLVRNVD